jgi:hypothetical protein
MKEIEDGANQEGIYLNETGMLFKEGRSWLPSDILPYFKLTENLKNIKLLTYKWCL